MSSSKSNSRGRNSPLYTYAALAVAAASIAYYIYQRSQPRERRDNRTGGEGGTGTELERNETQRNINTTNQTRLRRVVDSPTRGRSATSRQSARIRRKQMSISLKDTLIWNPSNDPDSPNYAFVENVLALLQVLTKSYDIHLVAPVRNDQEKEQILSLFRNADLFSSIDERKVLFCETEEGKIHIVRHLESPIHIEGGTAETVDLVRGFVERIVWINSKANNNNTFGIARNVFAISSNSASSSSVSSVDTSQWTNVEICNSLLASSLNLDRLIKRRK
ncbi:12708_t:CDS:2 [Ambispora gerdemannii]|uniref:12708_t:CDS:1 n=1 Tax=Ambispora gerdemannii TaxID=144530 RepID=A0A9N8WR69_9GLOM|nr:12708_t:CDS:2 [Ambispora gerdemannii]